MDYSTTIDTNCRAGAHWRTHAKKDDFEQQKWDLETYVQWLEVVEEEKARETRGEVIKEEDRTGIAVSCCCRTCYAKH